LKTRLRKDTSTDTQTEGTKRLVLARVSSIAGISVALGGLIALTSWWSNKPNAESFLALKPDVAVTFILAGISVRLLGRKGAGHTISYLCAILVTAIGFLSWFQHGTNLRVSLNEFFRFLPAGRAVVADRMPLATGFNFFLTGCALLLSEQKTKNGNRPSHTIALIASVISAIALIGWLYHVYPLYYKGDYQYLALYTPILFLLLAVGILCSTPDGMFMEVIIGHGVGSVMLRYLLPSLVVLLVLLSWLRLAGQRAGIYEDDVGTAIMVIVHILIFACLVFGIAISLNRSDLHRELLERRVHERTLMLEGANRELEAFAYSVAHDLRAPLRAIDGLSLIILEDYAPKLDSTGKTSLERIRENAHRMNQLINGLLELSRMSRAQMHPSQIDLTQIAKHVISELRQREPNREADIVIAEGLSAQGDPSLMGAVLENLLNNAWKFSARQPRTHIEFGRKFERAEPVFFIRDNGIGFDMNYADKLFGPFQRLHTNHDFAGHGIGLATVQRVIHRHGGRIWAESKVDHGATFFFTLQA
jgi:signal transduction histidine kinase